MLTLNNTKLVIAALAAVMLTACGGGDGNSSNGNGYSSGESITYITSGGLRWSSPSNATYVYASGLNSTEPDAFGYCSRSTSTNGGPSIPSNFNNESGWSVPTDAQMVAFRLANPNPSGWSMTTIWFQHDPSYSGSLNTYINYGTGVVAYVNVNAKAHVVCVKPVI